MATAKTKKPRKAAASSRKLKLQDLPPEEDRAARLDPERLLRAAQPVLTALAKDLRAQAKGSAAVTAALRARHAEEKAAERTADPYDVWLRAFVEQVAAAWLLSCVFVRVLEDRGLVAQNRIAGPGALDSQQLFFELAPSLSERDYLRTVFRELSQLPAAADLFDARHNPIWLLAPSAEGARALLELFRTPSPHAPALRFGQPDTRFLGDLYQDLSEDVRKRYALLQTPAFVEQFILDRTLERAIERFGLNETTLIDPTCGSGHFLLGAFERLLDHRLRNEPGLDVRQAALKALDAVSGADINPYAVAIARFRLTLAYLDKAGHERLAQAPKLPLHLVVADSLLHNPQGKLAHQRTADAAVQMGLGEAEGVARSDFEGSLYVLEDEAAARDVLHRRYAAVVGNPPYITVKDKARRDAYRALYATCHREYSLAVPFKERFFQLAREGGAVGMITANSFMKREFGKKVIEEFLPTVNLDLIVNTSGAYIPGHGTPTVLLFGTSEAPQSDEVLTVLAKRGEPTTPAVPEQGLVWSSIAAHWSDVGFDDDYISVAQTRRDGLAQHPWSLAGGGAGELKALLEARAEKRLCDVVDVIGFGAVTREDELYLAGRGALVRAGVPDSKIRPLVAGENVRDWAIADATDALWPYAEESLGASSDAATERFLWPYKRQLSSRVAYGKSQLQRGLAWFEYSMFFAERFRTPLSITFAFVATHNHFVLDHGGKVFKQTAPIIKLPEGATEDDHLALLAYLNSSTACFWMKQVFQNRGYGADSSNARTTAASWEDFYEIAGTGLKQLPLPDLKPFLPLGKALDARAVELRDLEASITGDPSQNELAKQRSLVDEMVSLQEEIDWTAYRAFDLSGTEYHPPPRSLGDRDFERFVYGRSAESDAERGWWKPLLYQVPTLGPDLDYLTQLSASAQLRLLESMDYKRPWRVQNLQDLGRSARTAALLNGAEQRVGSGPAPQCIRDFARPEEGIATQVLGSSVPFLAAHRYTDSGLEKRAAWERTWDLQRREDAGEDVGEIPVPPKYAQKDFRSAHYWRLRGKLDVPKERFISYPGCESDEDGEPLYGWAGWDHLQRAQALAGLYEQRKGEGWDAARLTPMLAGLLELIPWITQWHNEPNPEFDDMRLGDYFHSYLEGECALHGLSHEALRGWRPSKDSRKKRGKG